MNDFFYRKLQVYQQALLQVKSVYEISKRFPSTEQFALTDQIRRAVISIPSNIAEGFGRKNQKEFHRFLLIARGSAMELETQLKICVRVGYLKQEKITDSLNLLSEISKIISSLLTPKTNS